jgi:hypothetical protein
MIIPWTFVSVQYVACQTDSFLDLQLLPENSVNANHLALLASRALLVLMVQ